MNETLKRIGFELRRRYEDVLRRPMNWRLIDAFVRLEEFDEDKARKSNAGAERAPDASRSADNVVELKRRADDGS
ncbi:MAG: hypothetical protein ACKVP4_08965 [Hyphomicrobium sp.]